MVLICFNMVVFRPSKLDLTKSCFKKNGPKFLGEVFEKWRSFCWGYLVLKKRMEQKRVKKRSPKSLWYTEIIRSYFNRIPHRVPIFLNQQQFNLSNVSTKSMIFGLVKKSEIDRSRFRSNMAMILLCIVIATGFTINGEVQFSLPGSLDWSFWGRQSPPRRLRLRNITLKVQRCCKMCTSWRGTNWKDDRNKAVFPTFLKFWSLAMKPSLSLFYCFPYSKSPR